MRKFKTLAYLLILLTSIKRTLSAGVSAKYLRMDSWFTMPATVVTLSKHLKVIGMVKKSSRIVKEQFGDRLKTDPES